MGGGAVNDRGGEGKKVRIASDTRAAVRVSEIYIFMSRLDLTIKKKPFKAKK